MDFKVSVSACGTIQDNQAWKLDKKRIYARVYDSIYDNYCFYNMKYQSHPDAPFRVGR